jgi:hypothetical protein
MDLTLTSREREFLAHILEERQRKLQLEIAHAEASSSGRG